jgi:hypothetical protein
MVGQDIQIARWAFEMKVAGMYKSKRFAGHGSLLLTQQSVAGCWPWPENATAFFWASSFDAVARQVFCRWVFPRSLGTLAGATKIDLKKFQREIEISSSLPDVVSKAQKAGRNAALSLADRQTL